MHSIPSLPPATARTIREFRGCDKFCNFTGTGNSTGFCGFLSFFFKRWGNLGFYILQHILYFQCNSSIKCNLFSDSLCENNKIRAMETAFFRFKQFCHFFLVWLVGKNFIGFNREPRTQRSKSFMKLAITASLLCGEWRYWKTQKKIQLLKYQWQYACGKWFLHFLWIRTTSLLSNILADQMLRLRS